jgi:hypothetical protein
MPKGVEAVSQSRTKKQVKNCKRSFYNYVTNNKEAQKHVQMGVFRDSGNADMPRGGGQE